MPSKGPKILTADIETLPLTTHNWSLFDEPRSLDKLVKDWAIYMGAWKWMGRRRVEVVDTEGRDPYDDKEVVEALCDALNDADIVVGQNVQKFDLRKIRARAVFHGLKPFKEPAVVDTMLMAKEIGYFTSNKLEYLSTMTETQKSKHNKFPGFSMWLAILDGNPAAYKESRAYNRDDVKSTEQLYLKLRPWCRRHPNMAHYYDDDFHRCPKCGSVNIEAYGGTIFRGVSEYTVHQCSDCGGFSRTRFTENTKDKRKALLSHI